MNLCAPAAARWAALSMTIAAMPVFVRAQPAAGSAQATCNDARVQIEGVLSDAWLDSVVRLCDALAKMDHVDPSARLHIVQNDAELIVGAMVGDGRVAVRRVHAQEDLLPTVQALVVLPAEPASGGAVNGPLPVSPLPAAAPVAIAEPAAPEPLPRAEPAPVAAAPRHDLDVEIGAAFVGRVARAPTYLSAGPELYGGLRNGDWLFALKVRWEPAISPLKAAPSGFEMDSVGAGFEIVRRLLEGPVALDAGVDTLLLAERQDYTVGNHEATDTDADVRIGLLGRLLLGAPKWRWALSLASELSPLRVRHDLRVADGLPTLPMWAIALGLGATWEDL